MTVVTISLFVKHNDLKNKEIQTSLQNTVPSTSCFPITVTTIGELLAPSSICTPHMCTHTRCTEDCPSEHHSPVCMEANCGWQRHSSVFLRSLGGGKSLVKYTRKFYFNQSTTCITLPPGNIPLPLPSTHHSAFCLHSVCPFDASLHH